MSVVRPLATVSISLREVEFLWGFLSEAPPALRLPCNLFFGEVHKGYRDPLVSELTDLSGTNGIFLILQLNIPVDRGNDLMQEGRHHVNLLGRFVGSRRFLPLVRRRLWVQQDRKGVEQVVVATAVGHGHPRRAVRPVDDLAPQRRALQLGEEVLLPVGLVVQEAQIGPAAHPHVAGNIPEAPTQHQPALHFHLDGREGGDGHARDLSCHKRLRARGQGTYGNLEVVGVDAVRTFPFLSVMRDCEGSAIGARVHLCHRLDRVCRVGEVLPKESRFGFGRQAVHRHRPVRAVVRPRLTVKINIRSTKALRGVPLTADPWQG
jgi:hypothetical protein